MAYFEIIMINKLLSNRNLEILKKKSYENERYDISRIDKLRIFILENKIFFCFEQFYMVILSRYNFRC